VLSRGHQAFASQRNGAPADLGAGQWIPGSQKASAHADLGGGQSRNETHRAIASPVLGLGHVACENHRDAAQPKSSLAPSEQSLLRPMQKRCRHPRRAGVTLRPSQGSCEIHTPPRRAA